jgi:sodium/bile acid cotransporter 7
LKFIYHSKALIKQFAQKYWFLIALLTISLTSVADQSYTIAKIGRYLKNNYGPEVIMASIFFLSGLTLSFQKIKEGLMDVSGTLMILTIIFIIAPSLAGMLSQIQMDKGIIFGLLFVSVMPSTLSSGVVMTAAAGGNPAHALVVTIISNCFCIFTIPYSLAFLLSIFGHTVSIEIDKAAIMSKIIFFVILPLTVGILSREKLSILFDSFDEKITLACQMLILLIVWIAISQTKAIFFNDWMKVLAIVVMVTAYHGLLLLFCWGFILISRRNKGSRESILFIGGQKTLPLSIMLQMSLFPKYGIIVLVCVLHHIIHLMIDAYLVERLKMG